MIAQNERFLMVSALVLITIFASFALLSGEASADHLDYKCDQSESNPEYMTTTAFLYENDDEECVPRDADWWTDGPGPAFSLDSTTDYYDIYDDIDDSKSPDDFLPLYLTMWSGDSDTGVQQSVVNDDGEKMLEVKHTKDWLKFTVKSLPEDETLYLTDGDSHSARIGEECEELIIGDNHRNSDCNEYGDDDSDGHISNRFNVKLGPELDYECDVNSNEEDEEDDCNQGEEFREYMSQIGDMESISVVSYFHATLDSPELGPLMENPITSFELSEWAQDNGFEDEDILRLSSTLNLAAGTDVTYRDPIDQLQKVGERKRGVTQIWNNASYKRMEELVSIEENSYYPTNANLNDSEGIVVYPEEPEYDDDGSPEFDEVPLIQDAYIEEFSVSESVLVYNTDDPIRYIPRDGKSKVVIDYRITETIPTEPDETSPSTEEGDKLIYYGDPEEDDVLEHRVEWSRVVDLDECNEEGGEKPEEVDENVLRDCEYSVDEDGDQVLQHEWDLDNVPDLLGARDLDYQAKISYDYKKITRTCAEGDEEEDKEETPNLDCGGYDYAYPTEEEEDISGEVYVKYETDENEPVSDEDNKISSDSNIKFAKYPDGSIGVHVSSPSRLWSKVKIGGPDSSYGISNMYKYFNARDEDWDMLQAVTPDGQGSYRSPSHPQQMRAFPADNGPFSWPVTSQAAQENIRAVYSGPNVENPEEDGISPPTFSNTNYAIRDTVGGTGSELDKYKPKYEVAFKYNPTELCESNNEDDADVNCEDSELSNTNSITIIGMLPSNPPSSIDNDSRYQEISICDEDAENCENNWDNPEENFKLTKIYETNLTTEFVEQTEDLYKFEYTVTDNSGDPIYLQKPPLNRVVSGGIKPFSCTDGFMAGGSGDKFSARIVDEYGNTFYTNKDDGKTGIIEYKKSEVTLPIEVRVDADDWWSETTNACRAFQESSATADGPSRIESQGPLGFIWNLLLALLPLIIAFAVVGVVFNAVARQMGYDKTFWELIKEILYDPMVDFWENIR